MNLRFFRPCITETGYDRLVVGPDKVRPVPGRDAWPTGAGRFGHFDVVKLDNGVSLDFASTDGPIRPQHYAFLISEADFDAVLGRIRDRRLDHWADPARDIAPARSITSMAGAGSGASRARRAAPPPWTKHVRVLEGLAQAVASEDRSTAEEWRGQLVDHLCRHSASLRRAVKELYEASGKWQRAASSAPDSKQIQNLISRVISLLSKRS